MEFVALKIGSMLHHGTYKIMRVLGQGGFGITYLAHDMNLDKPVAIKEFFPEALCSRDGSTSHITVATQSTATFVADLKARFLKEARNIARLNHPNIIRIFTAFEENNTAYYVMEYVHGISLQQMVEKGGPIGEEKAKYYINQVGEALEYLHSNHMTHLDVKPANIMVRSADDCPILIDFGLSKNYDMAGSATTTRGALGVSPGFSPAEQYIMGGSALFNPKSDLYSLAATFYYLVTGTIPPEGPLNVASQLTYPDDISPNVKDALIRAMSIQADRRHDSIGEFLHDINQTAPSYGARTVVGSYHTVPAQAADYSRNSLQAEPTYSPLPEKEKKSNARWYYIIGGVLVAGLIVWAFMALFSGAPGEIDNVTQRFATSVNTGDKSTLFSLYPELHSSDSLISYLPTDNITVEKEGIGNKYRVNFTPTTSIVVKDLGNENYKVVDSYGLIGFSPILVDYARSRGVWVENSSDISKRDIVSDPDFVDGYLRHICVLTDARIRDVIKNQKCTASYNVVGRLFKDAIKLNMNGMNDITISDNNPMTSFDIVSQDDNAAVIKVYYNDEYDGGKSSYTVTLKKQKITSDGGATEYVWDIDDISGHPHWTKNREDRADYVNNFYNDLNNYGGPSGYWEYYAYDFDWPDYERSEFIENSNKFIQSLKKSFPDGVVK